MTEKPALVFSISVDQHCAESSCKAIHLHEHRKLGGDGQVESGVDQSGIVLNIPSYVQTYVKCYFLLTCNVYECCFTCLVLFAININKPSGRFL